MEPQALDLVVTGGYGVGKTIHMPFTNTTSFYELYCLLQDEFGPKLITVHSSAYDSQTICQHTLPVIGDTPILDLLGSFPSLPISISDDTSEITVRLVGLPKLASTQKIHSTDYISDLKIIIAHQVRISPKEICLTAADSDFDLSPELTIEESGIRDMSVVQVTVAVKGGSSSGCKSFGLTNVFDDQAIIQGQWGSAPEWRRACRGCSITGICTNTDCVAYKHKTLSHKNFESFNIGDVDAPCPMCSKPTDMVNLTFALCFYTIRGRESDKSTEHTVFWRKVGDYWQTWDPKKAERKEWDFIRVVSKELSRAFPVSCNPTVKEAPVADTCSICENPLQMTENIEMRPCCHSFHGECWETWNEHMSNEEVPVTCPLC